MTVISQNKGDFAMRRSNATIAKGYLSQKPLQTQPLYKRMYAGNISSNAPNLMERLLRCIPLSSPSLPMTSDIAYNISRDIPPPF